MSFTQAKRNADIVHISSLYAKPDDVLFSGTVFEIQLDNVLVDKSAMVLKKAIIPYSFYILHPAGPNNLLANNIFGFNMELNQVLGNSITHTIIDISEDIIIPEGNYSFDLNDPDNFQTVLEGLIIEAVHSHLTTYNNNNGTNYIISCNITYNEVNGKLKFNIFIDNVNSAVIKSRFRIDLQDPSTLRLAKMMGFTPYQYTEYDSWETGTHNVISNYKCQIAGPNVLGIRLNLLLKYDICGRQVNDCIIIPINANKDGLIIYNGNESENRIELSYEKTEIDKISVELIHLDSGMRVGGSQGLNGGHSHLLIGFY